MKSVFKNQTVIIRTIKDKEHPYVLLSSTLLVLNGYERAIMLELLSNSDDFIINKIVVEKRLGFPHKKFLDAWKSLEEKYYIQCDRFFGGVKWVINEQPNSKYTSVTNGNISTIEQNDSKYTSIIDASIIYTGDHLTSNKETNNNLTKPEDLSPKGEIKEIDSVVTDKIISAKAEISLSLTPVPVVDIEIDCISSTVKLSPKLDYGFSSLDEGQSLFEQEDFIDEDSIVLKQKAKEFDIKNNNKRYANQNQLPLFNSL